MELTHALWWTKIENRELPKNLSLKNMTYMENMDTPSTQRSSVINVTSASDKLRMAIQYMEYHNQYFNQNRLLYVKDISLNHGSDAIKWYKSIRTHEDTWVLFTLPSPSLSKYNPMGDGLKR